MSIERAPPPNCAGCAFWRKLRENEGMCRRLAPEPSTSPRRGGAFSADAQSGMVRRRGRGRFAVDRVAVRRLRLLAPSRRRAKSCQPRRHAHVMVGACRNLPPATRRAPPPNRAPRLLARNAGHGFLRRGRERGQAQHRRGDESANAVTSDAAATALARIAFSVGRTDAQETNVVGASIKLNSSCKVILIYRHNRLCSHCLPSYLKSNVKY